MMKQRRNCDLLNLLMLLSQQGPIGLALAWLVRLFGTWLRLVMDHRDLFSFDIAHNACAIPFVHVHSWSDVIGQVPAYSRLDPALEQLPAGLPGVVTGRTVGSSAASSKIGLMARAVRFDVIVHFFNPQT